MAGGVFEGHKAVCSPIAVPTCYDIASPKCVEIWFVVYSSLSQRERC